MVRNVYITGRGVISPAGRTFDDNWLALGRGKPCFTLDDDFGYLGRLRPEGDEALGVFSLDRHLKVHDRGVLMGLVAAREAWHEACGSQTTSAAQLRGRTAVIMGSSRGATATIEREFERFSSRAKVSVSASPTTTAGAFASAVAQDLGLKGLSLAVSSACATGLNAIGVALALVSSGTCEHALAGGAESSLTPFTLAQLDALHVRRGRQGSALFPCRPMHPERSGLLAAEGAACLALSARPEMLGGGPLARLAGFGAATETSTLTGISADGQVLVDAIEQALEQAGVDPQAIDLVVGHGAGTIKGDAAELTAYKRIFGAQLPALTFHKWMVGHMIGASAAFSVAMAVRMLETGAVPPLPYADDGELGFPTQPRRRPATVLVTALGFGGNASALLLVR